MTIAPSGNSIGVQDAGSNPSITTQTTYIDSSITVGNTSFDFDIGVHHGSPFNSGSTYGYQGIGGTIYGYAKNFNGGTGSGPADLEETGSSGSVTGFLGSGNVLSTYGYVTSNNSTPFINWKPGSITYTTIGWGHDMGSTSGIGSGSNLTWTSDGGESYEITQLLWMKNTRTSGTFPNTGNPNYFQGSHVADSDNSNYIILSWRKTSSGTDSGFPFSELNIGGLTLKPAWFDSGGTLVQSSSGNYNGSGSVTTGQRYGWYGFTDSQIDNIGTSASVDFSLKGFSTTTTFNNGIAEEFGGADSADVKMSDYYKGGDLVTSNVTASVPTSGEISVSDFQGATYAAAGFFNTTFNSDTYTGIIATNLYLNGTGYRGPGLASSQSTTFHTHLGTNESSLKPTTTFTSQANFLGLTARTFEIVQITTNALDNASSFEYSLGYVYDSFFLTLNTAGNVTSSMSNTGWTDIRIWTGSDSYSSPTLLLTRANTAFTSSSPFYDSTNNYTGVAIQATQAQVGGGLKSGLTQGDYADLFGTSSTASSNPQWNFAIT